MIHIKSPRSVEFSFSFHRFFTPVRQQALAHPRVRGCSGFLSQSVAFVALAKTDVYLVSNLTKGQR